MSQIHGGPSIVGGPGYEDNEANAATISDLAVEQTQLTDNQNDHSPQSLAVYNPRPNNRSRRGTEWEDDWEKEFNFLDNERYDREDPCRGIRQIMTGFKKWAHRYIGNCGGQMNHRHQFKRADKFFEIFTAGLDCPNQSSLWSPKNY